VLGGVAADVTQLQLQPKNFGSNAERAQPASVVRGFTLRTALGLAEERRHLVRPVQFGVRAGQFGAFWSAKSIVRTNCLLHFEVHEHKLRPCSLRGWWWFLLKRAGFGVSLKQTVARGQDGRPLHARAQWPFDLMLPAERTEEALRAAPLHYNHYRIQSAEWFERVKLPRGQAHTKGALAKGVGAAQWRLFNVYNSTDTVDTHLAERATLLTQSGPHPFGTCPSDRADGRAAARRARTARYT
jgi:hypothetical protein